MTNQRYQKYKETYKQYRKNNRQKMVEIQQAYAKRHPEKIRKKNAYYRNLYEYGGNKDLVLERDNWQCVVCGMNNEQHIIIFGVGLTIDHKDGKGRYSMDKNNSLNNLQTLCLRCHGKKDGLRGNQKRWRSEKLI